MIRTRTAGFRCPTSSTFPWSSASYNPGLLQTATDCGKETENAKPLTFNETDAVDAVLSLVPVISTWGPSCTYVDKPIRVLTVVMVVVSFLTHKRLIWGCLIVP